MGISLHTFGGSGVDTFPSIPQEILEVKAEAQKHFDCAEACDKNENYSTASEGYQKAAELGHTEAMVKLSDYFMNGRGMWKDLDRAAAWYKKAAELGNPSAMTKYGLCCERGDGVAKDTNVSVTWYQKAADHNDPEGLYRLALAYKANLAKPRGADDEERVLLERAVQLQYPAALGELGRFYVNSSLLLQNEERERVMKTGVDLLRKGVSLGDVEAMKALAVCYQRGCNGIEKSTNTFIDLMMTAVRSNDLGAIRMLGTSYEIADGVDQSFERAAALWKQGASLGDSFSMRKIADYFRFGAGVAQDLAYAAKLYHEVLLVDRSCREALEGLGQMFWDGSGVSKDRRHARRLFRNAACCKGFFACGFSHDQGLL